MEYFPLLGQLEIKCEQYWPNEEGDDKAVAFGHMTVTMVREVMSNIDQVIERTLLVRSKS